MAKSVEVQLGLWPPSNDRQWWFDATIERLTSTLDKCPVAGGVALSQWYQFAWDRCLLILTEMNEVAQKKTKEQKRVTDVQWVNYKLTNAEIEQFQAWDAPEDDVRAILMEFMNDGYRLTFAYDAFNKAVMCSVVCQDKDSPNFGKGYSTFARDWDKLVALVVFKHVAIFNRTWPEVEARASGAEFG